MEDGITEEGTFDDVVTVEESANSLGDCDEVHQGDNAAGLGEVRAGADGWPEGEGTSGTDVVVGATAAVAEDVAMGSEAHSWADVAANAAFRVSPTPAPDIRV